MENLADAVRRGIILLDADSHDMDDVLLDVVRRCVSAGLVTASSQERVLEKLRNREALDSTAIGRGVAIPHAYVEEAIEDVVVFVRLRHPIDVRAIDGEPARFLFVLIGPKGNVDAHLNLLAGIALAMSDNDLCNSLRDADTEDEILQAFDGFMRSQHPDTGIAALEAPNELAAAEPPSSEAAPDAPSLEPQPWSGGSSGAAPRTLPAVFLLFCSCLIAATVFGGLLDKATAGQIGVIEMLTATALGGTIFALRAQQPLIILGGTGSLLVFTGVLFRLCSTLHLPFLETYAWTGLWTALFVALPDISRTTGLFRRLTRFTNEILTALIALIFIVDAVSETVRYVDQARSDELARDAAFLSLILVTATFILATMLTSLRRARSAFPEVCRLLSDFGPLVTIALVLLFGTLFPDVRPERIRLPESYSALIEGPWIVPLFRAPIWVWFAAAIPALPASLLIRLEHNITARVIDPSAVSTDDSDRPVRDLPVVGMLTGVCSVAGLPWIAAASVRSLSHVRALNATATSGDPAANTQDDATNVQPARLTAVLVHLLIGVSLILLPFWPQIPEAVLYGLLLFVGIGSIAGTQLFERVSLWLKVPDMDSETDSLRTVPMNRIYRFTLLQLACLAVLWIIVASPAAILFPVFIALLVRVRQLADQHFTDDQLEILDSRQQPDEEATWVV